MEDYSISIVIPAYNCSEFIADTLEACLNQSFESEIIVVDDGSTDNSAEIIKKYPVKYIYQTNAGPATARNAGWKAATGEIICFTDSDCVPEKDWVKKILEKYTSVKIGGAGGSYDIKNAESLLAGCIHEEIIQRHANMPEQAGFLGTFNVSYRKKVLQQVGGFNESFRQASGEDNDLSYKVKKAGYKLVFDKNIRVAHYHQTRLLKYLKEQYRHGYWRMKLYRLHPDMSKGDNYAGLPDFIQPPLAMAVIVISAAAIFYKPLFYIVLFSVLLLLLLQLPVTLKAIRRNRKYSYLYLIVIFFLRAFARGFGMSKGILRFFVLDASKNGEQ
ncbi:MAG: glycosyltransferase [Sedimentisphaerales bacterium]|nr:glycosyltransferase [Sedimentisphaerales bacterium]